MNIVLLSPFFHPEPISTGRYNTTLAQGLVDRGCTVEVVASHPLYPSWRPMRSDARLPGMIIRRGGAWLRFPGNPVLRRLLLEFWYALRANAQLLRMRRRASQVIVVFPPSLLGATLRLALPRGLRIVGIVHDLQGVHAVRTGNIVMRVMTRLIHRVERRAFKACDRLIFLSHSMAERAIGEYGLARERCVVHYPFLTLPALHGPPTSVLAGTLPAGLDHVVYSGALGDKQDPDRLVTLMRELALRHPRVRCHVFSAGPHFERLRSAAQREGNGAVEFHPLVPENALDELYARSTVQLLPQTTGTAEGSLPSKLPNLLAAGVPVFAICDPHSEIVRLLQQAGARAGDHADDFDAAHTHARFESLLERVRDEPRSERIASQRPLVERLFAVEAVAREILDY